jgi:hypothetical protein
MISTAFLSKHLALLSVLVHLEQVDVFSAISFTMAEPPRHKGVTEPLSTAHPTDQEKKYSDKLVEELKRQNNFESTAETQKR